MKSWITLTVLILVVTLVGCVRMMTPSEYRILPSPVSIPNHPETATVVFLWPNGFADPDTLAIYQGDTIIGALRGSTAFAREVVPGLHRFSVFRAQETVDKQWLELMATAGQTLYVQYIGRLTGYTYYLALIHPEIALAYLPQLSTIELVPHDSTALPVVEPVIQPIAIEKWERQGS